MSSNTANRSRHPWLSSVRLAGLSVLALVTALTLTIEGDDPRPDPDNRDLVSTLQPSSTATGVTWQVFSDQGKLDYDVSAKQLEQYPSQQLMKAAKPIVRMASQEKYPWVLRAVRGVLSPARATLGVAAPHFQTTQQRRVKARRESPTDKK